jgi:hypothetical protein
MKASVVVVWWAMVILIFAICAVICLARAQHSPSYYGGAAGSGLAAVVSAARLAWFARRKQ